MGEDTLSDKVSPVHYVKQSTYAVCTKFESMHVFLKNNAYATTSTAYGKILKNKSIHTTYRW